MVFLLAVPVSEHDGRGGGGRQQWRRRVLVAAAGEGGGGGGEVGGGGGGGGDRPQFRSPLIWDVFAVSTYGTVSLLFWYVGLIPDLATLRDRTSNRYVQIVYGVLAMGWRGSAYHWKRYEVTYLILAGLATPLVVSVHTVVSFDFAVAILPGWHSTIFPPYFVAGAIYSGFAMVLVLAIPLRVFYGLEDFITQTHLQNMAKVMLATGLMVGYGYGIEAFMGFF